MTPDHTNHETTMSGTVHIPDDPAAGSWKAHERDGSIALQIKDADGRQVAEVLLDSTELVGLLIALDEAEEKRQPTPAA